MCIQAVVHSLGYIIIVPMVYGRYQHSRQLVSALNRFTDIRADLPQDWEKKLNREGKVQYVV